MYIEKTLLDMGKPVYDKVIEKLNNQYHCYLTDCYEHPEYLSEILKQLYGASHKVIVESIKKQLEEYSNNKPIARFIELLV